MGIKLYAPSTISTSAICWSQEINIPISSNINPADIIIYNANMPNKGMLAFARYVNTGGMGGATALIRSAPNGGGSILSTVIASAMIPTTIFCLGTGIAVDTGGSVYIRFSARNAFQGTLYLIWLPSA